MLSYNKSHTVEPKGLFNTGAICYFNATVQSLLSCTSFVEKCKDAGSDNKVMECLKKVIGGAEPSISAELWKYMSFTICAKNEYDPRKFMKGQQCAREGYHRLLESIEEYGDIQDLFLHRYRSMIFCEKCDDFVSNVETTYNVFEIQPNLESEQLENFTLEKKQDMNNFLSEQHSYVESYVCGKCKDKSKKYRIDKLVMVPEVLVVLAKKYVANRKINIMTEFPEFLEFNGSEKKFKYCAVANVEHGGGLNGGHYWAVCKRGDKWYCFNDLSVKEVNGFKPTVHTYMVYYHLM